MSRSFSDGATMRARAERNLRDGTLFRRRWWTRKYELPPNHPLFLERSVADLQQEMCEDLLWRRKEIMREIEEEGDKGDVLKQELDRVNEALGGEAVVVDDLWDQWEADLEAGREPDLEAGL